MLCTLVLYVNVSRCLDSETLVVEWTKTILLVAILRVFCGAAELCQIHVVVIIVMEYMTFESCVG